MTRKVRHIYTVLSGLYLFICLCLLQELAVFNMVEKFCVSLEGDGSLYFQPTAVGSQTQRTHHLRNLSRLPLRLVFCLIYNGCYQCLLFWLCISYIFQCIVFSLDLSKHH